jgi:hypothetical protein
MKSARFVCFSFLIFLFLFSTLCYAGVPQMINYQGKITKPTGALVDTTISMTFAIYTDSTGTDSIWSETQSSVVVQKGVFSILLGSVTPIPDSIFDGSIRYLAIKVGSDPEMSPRKAIVSVAYAMRAGTVEGTTGGTIHGDVALVDSLADTTFSIVDGDVHAQGNIQSGNSLILKGEEYKLVSSIGEMYFGRENGSFGDIKVGIGTTTPSVTLDVNGVVEASRFFALDDYLIDGRTVLSSGGSVWDGNIVVGVGAEHSYPGNWATLVGDSAGANGGGDYVTYVGWKAGYHPNWSNTGDDNTFIGAWAGMGNTIGHRNTFVGLRAGSGNMTGYHNTYIGHRTGEDNMYGHHNTIVGDSAGSHSIGSDYNTFLGSGAGCRINGGSNTFLGAGAGGMSSTGDGNIFVGHQAGYNESGSNKLYIDNTNTTSPLIYGEFDNDILTVNGKLGIGTTTPTSKLDIRCGYGYVRSCGTLEGDILLTHFDGGGEGAAVTATLGGTGSSEAYLAGESGTVGSYAGLFDGDVYISDISTGTGTDVVIDGNGKLLKKSSSKSYKENIRELNTDPSLLFQLEPVRFEWRTTGEEDIGLVAEQVDEVMPDLVICNKEGKPDAVKYDRISLYLLEIVKEQQERISALEKEILDLKR